jgi:FemAB-related protein (PEP-CTERM system-associated)
MRIRLAEERDQPAWDRFVQDHPEGLAYHAWAWKQAVEAAYGFSGLYLIAEDSGEGCGVLPLIRMKRALSRPSLVSLPYCDIGGCLAADEKVGKALVARARELAGEEGARVLELRSAGSAVQGEPLNKAESKVRMLMDLPGDSGTLLESLKAKVRSQVRKPERDGLSVRLGGLELVGEFYRIFAENMRDLGSPVHSRRWIEAVVRFFGERGLVGVVSTPCGEPAAAGILLMHSTTVSVPWASSLRRHNSLNPNMLLYWSFLAYAADHGHRVFDFGRSTRGEGTYRFKRQWGAKSSPLFWQELLDTRSNGNALAGPGRGRRAAEAVWSRLPMAVSTFLGPRLRRHISL